MDTIKEWLGKIAGKDNLVIGERSELMQYMQKSQSELVALMKEGVGKQPVQFGKQTDAKYMFAGTKAKQADIVNLRRAEKMTEQGMGAEQIFAETGWFKGKDGKWRFEIDDSGMEYVGGKNKGKLKDFIQHDELFANYPQLANAKVKYADLGGSRGRYSEKKNTVYLDKKLKNAPERTLVHEIQHAIQRIEGFETGGNKSNALKIARDRTKQYLEKISDIDYLNLKTEEAADNYIDNYIKRAYNVDTIDEAAYMVYRELYGEQEARLTAGRMDMDAAERRRSYPEYGERSVLRNDVNKKSNYLVEEKELSGNADEEETWYKVQDSAMAERRVGQVARNGLEDIEADGKSSAFSMRENNSENDTKHSMKTSKPQDKTIRYDKNGKPYAEITEDIFKGHEGEKPHKVVKDYLKNNIGKYATLIESGQRVYFGKDLPGEYTQSKATRNLSKERLNAKNQAAQTLNEMIETAEGRRWEKSSNPKHEKDAKYGFYKYNTRFKVGNDIYGADILIRNDADGKKYLYDILGIKKETVSQDGVITPYVPTVKNNSAVAETDGISNITIPQRESVVNSQSMQNMENYAGKSGFDAFEAGERERVSKALGRSVTSPVYAQTEAVTRQQKRLVKDLKAVGIDAVFFENASTLLDGTDLDINGAYKDGTVYINVNAENPYRAVVGHELTHRLKQADAELYQKIEDIVAKNMGGDAFAKMAENVREEKVADIIGDIMENPRNYREILNQNPNLIQRIMDTIKEWLGKIAGKDNLVIGERSELMQYMQKSQSELVALMKEGVGKQPVQFGKQADAKYQIKNVEGTNKQYVKADRQVITGDDPKMWGKQVFDYINNTIRNGKDLNVIGADGDVLTITSDTAGKAMFRNAVTRPDGTKTLMTDAEYAAKLRAEGHIDEISKVSTHGKNVVPDYKNHSFAKDGFNYRTAYFEDVDGQYYKLTLSVGKNGEINTVYNIGKIKEASLPLVAQRPGAKSSEEHKASKEVTNPARGSKAIGNNSETAGGNFSNNPTIPQKESVVKDIIRRNLENNSENDTKHSMKTSKLYENTLNKPFVTEETRKAVETNKDRFMYEGITNKETYAKGKMDIETFGADKVRERLYGKDKWKADDVAAGLAAFAEYQSRGEMEKAVGLAAVLRRKMTEAGQAVQALQIVNKMTPEGKLMNFLSEAEEMTNSAIEKNGRRAQIEEDLSKALTPKAKQEVLDRYKIPYVDDETTRIVSENLKLIETLNNKKDLIDIIKQQSDMRGTIAKVKSLEKTIDSILDKERINKL